jgi:hypothetical protein
MNLRDELVGRTVRDANTTSKADLVTMAAYTIVSWYDGIR